MVGPMAITELWNFPREAAVDVGVPPTFIADPATGNWTADFVYADPDGEPRPQGGVRFSSDGAGLAGGDEYYYEFTMIENWENEYTLYFFDAVEGEYYPLFAHTYPIIRSWQSIRYHGIEPYAIDLNTGFDSNGEYGPAVETRQGGIRKIQVEFDRAVTLLDPSSITISNGIDSFSPDTVMLENYDSLLVMTFSGSLPEQSCYTINLNEAIENLFGDSHCQVRSLIGDVSGDGIVNEEDEELMIENLGLSIEQDNAQYDLNLDGAISLLDLAILLDNFEALVFCEEPPSKYMIADISGPNGHPDYRVNLFDFMEIAAYWLECNDPFDASCDQ